MKKEVEEGYTGENEKFFQFNKRIVIRRDDGTPYLIRRTLIELGTWFSIKYHQILISDDVCPHDHPWPFITIVLKGGYYEWTPNKQKDSGDFIDSQLDVNGEIENCHWHKPGSRMYRPADWIHRLELKDANVDDAEQEPKLIPAHTLVFTGRIIRDWGFYTKNGWIFWKNYDKKKHC